MIKKVEIETEIEMTINFLLAAPKAALLERPPLTRGLSAELTGGETDYRRCVGFSPSVAASPRRLPRQRETLAWW